MKRLVVFLAIILILTIFVSIIHINRGSSSLRAQDSDAAFVQISSIELLGYDMDRWSPYISTSQEYVFDCGFTDCWVWERSTNDAVFRTNETPYLTTGFNSRYLFGIKEDDCGEAGEENAFLFDSQTSDVSWICLPTFFWPRGWSPFSDTIIYDGRTDLLDIQTQTLTTFSPPTSIDLENIGMDTGRGKYVWDTNSQQPIAKIDQDTITSDAPTGLDLITESRFELCPIIETTNCVFLFDTLDLTKVDVFNWSLFGHYLLWGGHESISGEPRVVGTNSNLRSDTVFFLTDLRTLVIQEIFRYSSLGYQDRQVESFTWLPDGQTFAVALKRLDDAPYIPRPTLEGGGYRPFFSTEGVLLIHLEWLDES